MGDATKPFATVSNRAQIREILSSVYDSLMLKGYNPINQLVGYILSEDPTYITNYNNARSLICRIDRDELLKVGFFFYVRAGISMAPSDAGGLDAVQNRTLPHYTEWCIEVRPYCLTNWN